MTTLIIKEGQLAELSKLAYVAIVTTFPWEQNFSETLFCSQHLRTIWKHLKISCFSINVATIKGGGGGGGV